MRGRGISAGSFGLDPPSRTALVCSGSRWSVVASFAASSLLGIATASGCGSAKSDAPASAVSAPPSTPVSELDPADVSALCKEYVNDSAPAGDACRTIAVMLTSSLGQGTAAERRSQCETTEQQCIDGYPSSMARVQAQCEAEWFAAPCSATVSEVERCIREYTEQVNSRYASVGTCSSDLSTPIQAPAMVLSGSCVTALGKCPSLFRTSNSTAPASNPTVTSCRQACDAYVRACSLGSCPEDCDVLVSVYGAACEALGRRFFDCAASGTFTCSESDLVLAPDGCIAERVDYVTCFALGGPTCARETALDQGCQQQNPALPYARHCVSDAVPAECQAFGSGYYCCPAQ